MVEHPRSGSGAPGNAPQDWEPIGCGAHGVGTDSVPGRLLTRTANGELYELVHEAGPVRPSEFVAIDDQSQLSGAGGRGRHAIGADGARSALHRWLMGREVPEDRHVSAPDAGSEREHCSDHGTDVCQ